MIQWRPHEILKPPSDEEMAVMDAQDLVELHALYHEAISNAETDPYRYGFQLDNWKKAWDLWQNFRTLFLSGANRSGKTTFGARTVIHAALENPGSVIYCFSQTERTSVEVQQAAVYEFLPAELKRKNTGEVHYLSYSAQMGFTNNGFILPNKSRVRFLYYTQFQQNQSILEGMELGSKDPKWTNVGAWADEYLGGMEMLDRLYLRLATRNAKLLLTFTPKDGVTETVANFLRGAVTIESRPAELLNNRKVPFIQENRSKSTGIVYFHSKDNPWSGYESIVEMCRAKNSEAYTLTAAYGVATKSYTTKFPKFSAEVNVIKPEQVPKTGVTRYQVIDPAGRKNWAMIWIAVAEDGTFYVYREWPDVSVGDWIEQGKNGKWMPGEGAKGLGYGYRDYIEMIAEMEKDQNGKKEEIFERLIDPRLGAQRYQKDDGDSCIIDDLEDLDFLVTPAPGDNIEDGIQKLVDKMAYDQSRPIDYMNRPKFYVSDECRNLITCLAEYTGDGGKDEPAKDFIDLIRYAAAAEIDHVDPATMVPAMAKRGGY